MGLLSSSLQPARTLHITELLLCASSIRYMLWSEYLLDNFKCILKSESLPFNSTTQQKIKLVAGLLSYKI